MGRYAVDLQTFQNSESDLRRYSDHIKWLDRTSSNAVGRSHHDDVIGSLYIYIYIYIVHVHDVSGTWIPYC